MTEQTWINQCAQRLISLYGYGRTDADALKQAEKEMRCPPQEEKEAA